VKIRSLKAGRCDSGKGWLGGSEGSDVQEGAGLTIRLIALFISSLSDQTQVSTMTFIITV